MITCSPEATIPSEPLAELELQIARRADELAATRVARSSLNLVCWLQAEQEIWEPILKKTGARLAGTDHAAAN